MEYHGKLFGKIGNKYFDTGRTSEEFDNMSKRLAEFELEKDSHSLEYWKKRCELAEKFISESPCDPDITKSQLKAYEEWNDFIGSAKAGIEPEENFLSFGINEIKALDAYVSAMRSEMNKVGELTPGRSQDFDNLFMHVNNLKKLAGIFVETNIIDAPVSIVIPNPMHDNFRAKYPQEQHNPNLLNGINGEHFRVIPDRLSESDEVGELFVNNPNIGPTHVDLNYTQERQEEPIKWSYIEYEKTLPIRPKMAFKVPMSQITVGIDGTIWRWRIKDGKVQWFYIGSSFSHTENKTP